MLFKRRNKQPIWLRARDMIWPPSGFKRSFLYLKHRLIRLPANNRSVAMGLTIGCIISWTPTMPFQILQCFILCLILRANFLAAVIGTVIGNPWTFSFLSLASYEAGKFILTVAGFGELMTVDVNLINILKNLVVYPKEVWWPAVLGGYILAIITLPAFYYTFYYLVKAERAALKKVVRKVYTLQEHRKEKKHVK